VRALGRVIQDALDRLRGGITVEGVHYGPIEATLDREQGANVWLTIGIREGKNREVRKVLETLDLKVNRLIRVAFGPFELGELDDGAVEEVKTEELRKQLGPEIATQAQADFDAPLVEKLEEKSFKKSPSPSVPLRGAPPSPRKRGEGGERQSREPGEGHVRAKKHQRRDRTGGPRPKYPR
jgi:23S rRNA pseudouridine2605 synthase